MSTCSVAVSNFPWMTTSDVGPAGTCAKRTAAQALKRLTMTLARAGIHALDIRHLPAQVSHIDNYGTSIDTYGTPARQAAGHARPPRVAHAGRCRAHARHRYLGPHRRDLGRCPACRRRLS